MCMSATHEDAARINKTIHWCLADAYNSKYLRQPNTNARKVSLSLCILGSKFIRHPYMAFNFCKSRYRFSPCYAFVILRDAGSNYQMND